jgi:hypothetical protein
MSFAAGSGAGMKRIAVIAGVILAVIVCYLAMYPTTSYRFRITLNVDTPQGLKSGSSVMEVRTWRYPAWLTLGNNTGESSLKGEAVFVDLGPDTGGKPRNVIAVLASGPRGENVDFYLLPGRVFEPLWAQKPDSLQFRAPSSELPKLPAGTNAELRGTLIPTLVTFIDLNDPKTADVIQPGDFEQTFGKGVMLRDVKIEIVPAGTWPLTVLGFSGEPLTRVIATKLPSLKQLLVEDKIFSIERAGDPFRVRSGHFQSGF